MIRKNISGGMLLEVMLILGIMMLLFPMLHRGVRDRSEHLRQDMVIRDMTLLKSLTSDFIENLQGAGGFAEGELIVVSHDRIPAFLYGRTRRNFDRQNALGQTYSIRLKRRAAPPPGTGPGTHTGFDAIIVADGAEVPSRIIREIVRGSRGVGGYVEDGRIYGATWMLDTADWDGPLPISNDALVFKVGAFRRDALFLSRTNPRYAVMKTDLFMRGNDITSAGNITLSGGLETTSLTLARGSETRLDELALDGGLSIRGPLTVQGVITFVNGLIRQNDIISGGEILGDIEISDALNIMGSLRLTAAENRTRLVDTVRLSSALAAGLEIIMNGRFYIPSREGIIEGYFVSTGELNVRAINMRMREWEGTVGLHFQDRLTSATNPRYGIRPHRDINPLTGEEEDVADAPLGFFGNDIIIRNVNERLYGTTIGGITISHDTPISLVIRALNYEHADLYRLITGSFPAPNDRFIPEYSLPLRLRCLRSDCSDTPGWDQGL